MEWGPPAELMKSDLTPGGGNKELKAQRKAERKKQKGKKLTKEEKKV